MDDNKKTVLLVDDDQFLRSMYANKFMASGFEVIAAGSADEAIDQLHGGLQPTAIVFDVVMPHTDGYAFMDILSKEKLALASAKIALSNEQQLQDPARLKELGIDGQLMKASGVPSEIVAEVERIIAAKKITPAQ
jgi:CheY-like chemotaxis protein